MNIIVEKRPWGRFERFTLNELSTVKLIYLKSGQRLSLQYHLRRSEFWRVIMGQIKVTLNENTTVLSSGESIEIPVKTKHRMAGIEDSIILEISRGEFDENDIIRIDDDYTRVGIK